MVNEAGTNLPKKKESKKTPAKCPPREKIEEAKRKSLKIVESLLEPSVSEDLLIDACNSISHGDYLDVIEERNILYLCGYPLCPNELKPIKQKYHISVKTKKVYDITERKCFCSNICYKASNFLKAQLCSLPIWLRDEDSGGEPITLLGTTQNRGSAGEEVDFGHARVTVDDIERTSDEASESQSESTCSTLLSNELQVCSSELEKLKISERCTYSINMDTLESTLLNSEEKCHADECDVSALESKEDNIHMISEPYESGNLNSLQQPVKLFPYLDSDDDEDDRCNLLPDHKRYDSLISDDKYMPMIPKAKVRKAVLIDPRGNPDGMSKLSRSEKAFNQLELIESTLTSWITVETYHILLGEKLDAVKDKILKQAETNFSHEIPVHSVDKLERMKESYAKICLKLEKEEAIELNSNAVENGKKNSMPHYKAQRGETLSEDKKTIEQLKVSLFYKGETGLPETSYCKKKSGKKPASGQNSEKYSSGRTPMRMKEAEPVVASTSREVNVLPPVESLSKTTIRRQIVADRLKIVYLNILPIIGLHYRDIREDFRLLISTFNLTSTNVSLRPLEWKIIAVMLFRLIEKKLTTEKIWDQEKCWQLLEAKLTSFDISLDQIDSVLASVISHSHLKKLLLGY